MSENIAHYNLDTIPAGIKELAETRKLVGPTFVGQGLSRRVGSDCYGSYIVASKKIGKKTIWGIASAKQIMHSDWTEGSEDCSIDMATAQPGCWITAYGKGIAGHPKWWLCDENGKRYNGARAYYSWNGAYAYRDPSF